MTLADFRARYPEFADVSDTLVSACLAEAARHVEASVFGRHAEEAIGLEAADRLTLSPFGEPLRQTGDAGSTYRERLDTLRRASACALRIWGP